MVIRIIERGNPAREIVGEQKWDMITIHSNVDMVSSSVEFQKNGVVMDRQKMYDSDIVEFIRDMDVSENSKISQDGDILLYTRQTGEEELEIPEVEEIVSDDIIEI